MLNLFISAFWLGMIFNAAPGIVLFESFRRGLKGGFWPALYVQIGSVAGDAAWAALGLLGAAVLLTIPYVQFPLSILGIGLLFYLAYESYCDAQKEPPEFNKLQLNTTLTKTQNKNAIIVGAAISIVNPLNITYWTALGGTISAITGHGATLQDMAVFMSGFLSSSLLWCFIAAGFIARTRRYLTRKMWKAMHISCAIGWIILAIYTSLKLIIG